MRRSIYKHGAKTLPIGTPKLHELLKSRVHEAIIMPRAYTDESRAAGWHEEPGDPWHVRWWSGSQWTGQPVPFAPSMLAMTFAL